MNPKKFPKESLSFKDEETGNDIIQLTSHKSVHHHPFFHVNAYNLNQDKLYFISHRSGSLRSCLQICKLKICIK